MSKLYMVWKLYFQAFHDGKWLAVNHYAALWAKYNGQET